MIKTILRKIWNYSYDFIIIAAWPLNMVLIVLFKRKTDPNSVLHISYMVHVPFHTTRILRSIGMKADYLAIGSSPHWNQCDYRSPSSRIPLIQGIQEMLLFWRIVARYQTVHLHFAHTMSRNGWELPILKKLNRRIVIHYRGCEIRNYHLNVRLHPEMNICQQCDYDHYCITKANINRIKYASSFGDAFLVTTPDLLDFVTEGIHMPFFSPEDIPVSSKENKCKYPDRPIRILHWTNHPGIEGTDLIKNAIESLKNKGYKIEFVYLKGVSHKEVMNEIPKSDLTIGKMKMGYYANSQIEAMAFGVPTITWVRPEFMTDELENSGFIFTHIFELEKTLEHYLNNPQELAEKRAIARSSILKLHDNSAIARRYSDIYQNKNRLEKSLDSKF